MPILSRMVLLSGVALFLVACPALSALARPQAEGKATAPAKRVGVKRALACSGVTVTPATDLQAAVNAKPNATTFCLQPGTYNLKGSVLTKSYDRFIGQSGVIVDGQGKLANAFWGHSGSAGQVHVTVQNMVIQH